MKKKINCVLLIDDDHATNFLNRKIIEKAMITDHIEITLNGREAMQYLTNTGKYEKTETVYPQPELIFLDINMPVMDGWSFLDEYHKLDSVYKGKIIIVMLTTSFNPDDKVKAEHISEISDFKNKPLKIEIIDEIMKKHFAEYI
jgi:CheY-like chemotaxis protein